jgi:hypothetical protein
VQVTQALFDVIAACTQVAYSHVFIFKFPTDIKYTEEKIALVKSMPSF